MSRAANVLLAVLLLIVASPLLAVLWLAVVVTSGRPGLFRQTRVGHHGRVFEMFKLRTMTHLASAASGSFHPGSLSRVTPLGRRLRAWKLDELPQLWNVIRGDMALVGPRPEVQRWVDECPERWSRILLVRPGITDPASITFCREEEILGRAVDPEELYRRVVLPKKLDLYESYVATRSCGGDLRILFDTAIAVLSRNGATLDSDPRGGEEGVRPEAATDKPRTVGRGDSSC